MSLSAKIRANSIYKYTCTQLHVYKQALFSLPCMVLQIYASTWVICCYAFNVTSSKAIFVQARRLHALIRDSQEIKRRVR